MGGKLDKRLKDDWSRGDNETWDGKALGKCLTKKFTIRTSFTDLGNIGGVKGSVNKNGTDNLIITRFNVQTENAGTGLLAQGKPKRRFQCGSFIVGVRNVVTKLCGEKGPKVLPTTSGPCLRSGKNCPGGIKIPPPGHHSEARGRGYEYDGQTDKTDTM